MEHTKLECMKDKYASLFHTDDEETEEIVNTLFLEAFEHDKTRFIDLLLDALEKGK